MALFKRKDKDGKRKGENAIGKIIYGFLLFMPLIAVGVACLYVILNKNAYESYNNSSIDESYKIDNSNSSLLEVGHNYIYNGMTKTTSGTGWQISWKFTYENASKDLQQYFNTNFIVDGIAYATDGNYSQYFRFYLHNQTLDTWNLIDLIYYESNNQYLQKINDLNFTFRLKTYDSNFYIVNNIVYYLNTSNTLDNVFYYQLEKLEKSDLFNWTKNTGAYTVMHNVTEGIGITNTYTPMLMTYWLLISVIYFIFDIALILVWAVHDKIHELKDAI